MELVTVANDIFLVPPPTMSAAGDSPKLVVLFGWMGADIRHLQKYIALHHELFPSTPVLLIRSHPLRFFQPQFFRLSSLQPALPLIPTTDIIFHIVSNGGCSRFADFLNLRPIPPHSRSPILFDSSPGALELGTSILAFLTPFKNPLVRFVGCLFLTSIFFLVTLPDRLLGRRDLLVQIRGLLNDFDKVGRGSSRAYVYSKEDVLVQAWAVEAHARDASDKGFRPTLYQFNGSRHAEHLRQAPESYKEVVRTLWRGST